MRACFGGDEFICICNGLTAQEIENYILDIREDLHQRNIEHKASLCSDRITLSIGYAEDDKGTDALTLLQLADDALYKSKLSGRNTFKKKSVI